MNHEEMQTELDALKARIAELESQIGVPDWVPFPGEIVEVSDFGTDWIVRQLMAYDPDDDFPYKTGNPTCWKYARPLSDPNVIQLRPHTPGDPMPCAPDTQVLYRLRDGTLRMIGNAEDLDWSANGYGLHAWAPIPRVPL